LPVPEIDRWVDETGLAWGVFYIIIIQLGEGS